LLSFQVHAPYEPAGDQGATIDGLVKGIKAGYKFQTVRGVTGVGKTFIMAKTIEAAKKPTLILCHNKTLAAQVYEEMKAFLPNAAVEYFVSYYDYYQPEAYVPQSDTYIAKESNVNAEIDKLRHSATQSLLIRDDVVVVASISCIYGLGSPENYLEANVVLQKADSIGRKELIGRLVEAYYERNDADLKPGTFRVRGDTIDVMAMGDEDPIRIELWGDDIETIRRVHRVTAHTIQEFDAWTFFPAKHFVMPEDQLTGALDRIQTQLTERLKELREGSNILEAARLEQRTRFDMEMLREIGYCSGIENYSQPLSGRPRGDPGSSLLDYFPEDWLMIIDESHVSIPQARGMYNGDKARKETLINFGFRLPSALDNRPLKFHEFERKMNQVICTTATPGAYELEHSEQVLEAIVRPTGLIDPWIDVRPVDGQVDDLYGEMLKTIAKGERILITTLTKKMAEELTKYYQGFGLKVTYLHSDIDTLERIIILEQLRKGEYDVLIGINLLREGLDLPEVSLVAIFDADKIGFLRSATALIQTTGRAARHLNGRVIMYADKISNAMEEAISETARRRETQVAYNEKHGITPVSAKRTIKQIEIEGKKLGDSRRNPVVTKKDLDTMDKSGFDKLIKDLEKAMQDAAKAWDFERAASLRDEIMELRMRGPKGGKASERESKAREKVEAKVGKRGDKAA
jgi:excinuclease ABC subunit B